MKSSPSLDKISRIAKSAENAMGKEKTQTKSPEVLTGKLSDGFIGVQRKRRKFKQFFLSGTADDVNGSRVVSCLAERNITPNIISLFFEANAEVQFQSKLVSHKLQFQPYLKKIFGRNMFNVNHGNIKKIDEILSYRILLKPKREITLCMCNNGSDKSKNNLTD